MCLYVLLLYGDSMAQFVCEAGVAASLLKTPTANHRRTPKEHLDVSL